tara:strand:+ start:241 stop:378 length:138 start_codon:yes stop_codon:yes gene_type:complete
MAHKVMQDIAAKMAIERKYVSSNVTIAKNKKGLAGIKNKSKKLAI